MIPAIPYPTSPKPAYWGPVTAHLNFCEDDYLITTYIAEFINTLTNSIYIIYALHGLRKLHNQDQLTLSRSLPFAGLGVVGICSALFHITLREWPQLSDDLSMVVPTSLLFCRLVTFQMDEKKARWTNIQIVLALIAIYSVHLYWNNHALHGPVFLAMVGVIAYQTRRVLPSIENPNIRRKLARLATFGGASFITGFSLWLVDRYACGTLTAAKRAVGLPWAFLLEFHGWWHLLTGVGAYIFIVMADYLTSDRIGSDPGDVFGWPAEKMCKDNTAKPFMNGRANGAKTNGVTMNGGMTNGARTNGMKRNGAKKN